MVPIVILSSHFPSAREKTNQLLEVLGSLPSAESFKAPNQTVFALMALQMMSSYTEEETV
jgi:hypothetical protein